MPYYTEETLEQIRQLNLVEIVEKSGVILKKVGSSWMGKCPFHDDKNPSFSVRQEGVHWLWKCFGCGANGNVITYVMKKQNIPFLEAVTWLQKMYQVSGVKCQEKKPETREQSTEQNNHKPDEKNLTPYHLPLITDVMTYYQGIFQKNLKAQEYLKSRGLTNPEIYEHFKIGYSDGTLPIQAEIREELKAYGVLNDKDVEVFRGCCVFALSDVDGNVHGLYGRSTNPGKETFKHLYLKGHHKGVFNARAFKASQKIYITEGIIDALSLYQIGIREVVALFGTNGLTEDHLTYMRKHLTKEVVLCLDNDDAGKTATEKISTRLYGELGITCSAVKLPDGIKDMNEWLVRGMTKQVIEEQTQEVKRPPSQGLEHTLPLSVSSPSGDPSQDITFNFNHTLPYRHYRIKGFEIRRVGSLRVNVKILTGEGMHLDTFDLYSDASREKFKKTVKKLLDIEESVTHTDLMQMVGHLEELQNTYLKDKHKPEINGVPAMNPQDRDDALALLKDEKLLDKIVEHFHASGYIGEDLNLLTGYLVATSRKLSTPLGLYIIARSATGKTGLQDAILSFLPDEEYVKYTRLTDQALFYQDENALCHKVIAIEEERGAQNSDYGLRSLLTSKGITNAVPIKDPLTGKIKTMTYHVKGPTSQIITTTSSEIDYETYNRFIVTTIDESIEQTRNILAWQRKLRGPDKLKLHTIRASFTRLHQNAQRLLRNVEVINPYAEALTFTDSLVVARREHMKYQNLIETIALLRQYQKEPKRDAQGHDYIEVDANDINIANRIAREIFTRGLSEMSVPCQHFLKLFKEYVRLESIRLRTNSADVIVSARQLREYTGWTHYQVRRHLSELIALEYAAIAGTRGQGKHYGYQLLVDDRASGSDGIDLKLCDISGQDTDLEISQRREGLSNAQ